MKLTALLLLMAVSAESEADAYSPLQALLLWDAGLERFQEDFTTKFLDETVPQLFTDHFGMFMAFSSFSDKPNPYTGIGKFGGFPSHWHEDWCYLRGQGFSPSYEHIRDAFDAMPESTGLDQWDAQFEAILDGALDSQLGWVSGTNKVIILVTKSYGHSQALNRLADRIGEFNAPIECRPDGNSTEGGFGAQYTANRVGWVAPLSLSREDLYAVYDEYADLLVQKVCHGVEDEELDAQIAERKAKLELTSVPEPLDFDLAKLTSDPKGHCQENEYPAYSDVVTVLNQNDIKLLLVYANSLKSETRATTDEIVWSWALTSDEALADIPNSMEIITKDNLDNMTAIVSAALAQLIEGESA